MKSLQWIFLYTFRNILIFALLILFALFDGLFLFIFALKRFTYLARFTEKKREAENSSIG